MENVGNDRSAAGPNYDNRNKTLELLQDYICRQRFLLERTQADLDKLKKLKQSAADDPRGTLGSILDGNTNTIVREDDHAETVSKIDGRNPVWSLGRLSDLVEDMQGGNETTIIKSINWEVFKGHDVTPFLDMQSNSRGAHPGSVFPPAQSMPPPPLPNAAIGTLQPPVYPRSRDSNLLAFVREKRAQLVEPVLATAAAFLESFGPDSDSDCDVQDTGGSKHNKSKAHGSKMDAARRRKQEEAALIRPRGPGGVFIKRDKALVNANGVVPAARPKQKRSMPHSPDGDDSTIMTPPPQRRRTSSTNSIPSLMDFDELSLVTDKPRRLRRPSTRFLGGSNEPITRSRSASGKSVINVPDDPPSVPKIKLTIRLPPRASLNIRQPDLSPATSPSSTTSLRLRTASTSTSASTSRQSFSPPAFAFSPKDGDSEVNGYQYSSGEEEGEEDESRVGYDDDAMSVSAVTSTTRSRSRTRSETPHHHFGYKYASPYGSSYGGKFVATPSTTASPSGSVIGRRTNGKTNGTDKGKAKNKPKPETFNLPWSVSEQHLLEKLLVDYPDGIRNRWAKISAAMDGRRTPRQVASRVQKYFLKLKKFGVDVVGK